MNAQQTHEALRFAEQIQFSLPSAMRTGCPTADANQTASELQ